MWNGVDLMARAMLDHPELERFDLSTLRTGGFGAVGGGGHGLFEAVVERLGIPQLYQPYGMTEVNALSLWHDLDEPVELRALSGVKTPPGIDARVVHPETGRPCSPGEEGELQFRGMLVTPGYYKKPDETAAAFENTGSGLYHGALLNITQTHEYFPTAAPTALAYSRLVSGSSSATLYVPAERSRPATAARAASDRWIDDR